ncbi:hypothetical protein CNR22_04490 [Sphingobacteriaceae bacterium]|nr:hypothetical protein CNR22_04490 [Sphingobacteriaceae bacterium]
MKYLSFDLRALALMRICVAVVILLDLSVRITDLEAFYANSGVVPLNLLFEKGWNDYFISIHTMSGLWQVQLFLFLTAYLFAFLLFIGYRTRLFTFLSWFMLLSLHNRNGFILQGGDDLLRMILFWAMFIPWGARYSCDALLDKKQHFSEPTIYSVAVFAYLLQICYIYTGSALLKGPEWDHDFTAMYYVYGLDQVNYPITNSLFYYPELLKKLTMLAYYFELLTPLLFFIPLKHQWFRLTGVLFVVIFHLWNSLTLYIGMFPLIGMTTCLGILPSITMDWFDKRTSKLKTLISASFLALSNFLEHLIRWKKPTYARSSFFENAKTATLVFLTLFIFDWNFSNLSFIKSKLSNELRFIGYSLRLDQNWGMFAPGVFKDDGWFILEGKTDKNKIIDLWQDGKGVTYKKPPTISGMFRNDRWRKYSENLIFTSHNYLRGYFCNYSRRVWNEKHPDQKLKSLKIIYMGEFTQPDYKYVSPVKNILWECN